MFTILDQRKQAKKQWLQDPNQSNIDDLNNIRREMGLQEVGRVVWTGLTWLRIGAGGGHL